MKLKFTALGLIALSLVFVGCATKPKAPAGMPTPESSSIQAEATGLAPSGAEHYKSIDFALLFGSSDSVASWNITIADQKLKSVVRTVKGDKANLPEKFTWDGMTDSGKLAPEGTYIASLAVDYGTAFSSATVESKPFILDITPPSGSFAPNPSQFAYAPNGVTKPISVTISVKGGLAKATGWSLDVFDAAGNQVKSFTGAIPSGQVGWDGKMESGAYVQTAQSYPAVLTVTDEYGNTGTYKGAFSVADVPAAQASSVTTRRGGFSPTSSSVKNTLDLLLAFGSQASVVSWQVDVLSVTQGVAKSVRVFKGALADIPEYLRWDGKDDSGNLVPEGSYYASLAIDYGKTYKPAVVKSRNFSVVMTPPTGSITVDPPSVALAGIGPKNPVNLTVQAKSAFAQIASWVMAVYDNTGTSVVVFNGNWPNNKVAWDGKTVEGGSLIPSSRYSVVAKVQDEYGNVGDVRGTLDVEGLGGATEPSSIEAIGSGFAPTGDGSESTMAFKTTVGNIQSVKAWKVDIVNDQNIAEKSFKGAGNQLPEKLAWDGKIDNGSYAPEGRYSAILSLDYGVDFAPITVETKSFVLDLTPPSGSISLSSELFSPDGESADDTETISLSGTSSLARIVGWSLTAYDPGNNPFISWKGSWPAAPVVWDGKGTSGDLVESASDYPLVLKLRDEYGNVGTVKKNLATDILVLKVGDGYRIRVSSIVFKAFTADYKDVPPDRAARNLATLDLLAAKLKLAKFADYKIKLEGHAVMINWDNKKKGDAEQKGILIPLSKSRADAIERALAERGLSVDRLVTDGAGALNPIVPDSDFMNRWKNRRVEFYLLK